jgi:colanic acid/amylovoran biosynthesis glycosyltransferase
LFRHADRFTVNSRYARGVAAALGCPDAKLVRIPMGIDCTQFTPRAKRAAEERDAVTILFVGRLVEIKGPDVAVRAIARLREISDKAIRMIVVGDGPRRGDTERLVDTLGLRDTVVFRGALSQEATIACFAEADIFLYTGVTDRDGRRETQGLVIQEAQAMELPVVASDVGGVAEGMLPGETGCTCPERDVEAIAQALARLVADPEQRAAFGKRGRAFVKEHFDVGVLGNGLENVYRDLRSEA